MCDPLTIAAVAVTSAGAFGEAKAAKQAAKYRSAVALNNKKIALEQAEDARDRGETREQNFRRSLETLKGKERSFFAGSGVTVDEGTTLDIIGETAQLGEIDAMTIRFDAEREAHGFEVQGFNFQAESNLASAQASNINPFFSAFSTALTTSSAAGAKFGFGPTTPGFVTNPQSGGKFVGGVLQ